MTDLRYEWEVRRQARRTRRRLAIVVLMGAFYLLPQSAYAQGIADAATTAAGAAGAAGTGSMSGRVIQMVLMLTVLSLAPGILMTVTSFTRIVVALSLLRTGIGAQGVPPNPIIISLALFLSFFVMGPTFDAAWKQGIAPYNEGRITEMQALDRTSKPFHSFMLRHAREDDVHLFVELSGKPPVPGAQLPMTTLMPAFMISELRRAFEIGFLLLLPFLIIDIAVGAVLMAMGMMMLPPVTISLPMKIIFFVLVDGWALIAGSLVRSFGAPG
jgi:flagellar biosynthetic protein FliP